jgi:hypothetical protein
MKATLLEKLDGTTRPTIPFAPNVELVLKISIKLMLHQLYFHTDHFLWKKNLPTNPNYPE